MKNILNIKLVILPLLIATSSPAGILSKAAKGAKEAKAIKEAVRAEKALAFDPIVGRMRIAPYGTIEREVKILDQLRTRAARLFESKLSSDSKHSMINELNAAEDYFRSNPLRMDSSWTKKTFIEQQTKILDYYGRVLRNQNAASNTAQSTTKAGRKVGSR